MLRTDIALAELLSPFESNPEGLFCFFRIIIFHLYLLTVNDLFFGVIGCVIIKYPVYQLMDILA